MQRVALAAQPARRHEVKSCALVIRQKLCVHDLLELVVGLVRVDALHHRAPAAAQQRVWPGKVSDSCGSIHYMPLHRTMDMGVTV